MEVGRRGFTASNKLQGSAPLRPSTPCGQVIKTARFLICKSDPFPAHLALFDDWRRTGRLGTEELRYDPSFSIHQRSALEQRLMSMDMKTFAVRGSRKSDSEQGAYLDRIKSYPVLTEAEERGLIRRWYDRGDRAAFDALIGAHLRLVPKMASRYAGYGVPIADLIGEGNLGLLQSAERFEPEKGFRFSTYARWWIKAAMLNFILQTWSLIKVGNGAAKKRLFFNLRRAKQQLQGRWIALSRRRRGERHRQALPGLDRERHRHGQAHVGERCLDPSAGARQRRPYFRRYHRRYRADARRYVHRGRRTALACGCACAKPWVTSIGARKEIVTRRYLNDRPATLAKLANAYGLTAERVRQIEAKAIDKLRHYVRPKPRHAARSM